MIYKEKQNFKSHRISKTKGQTQGPGVLYDCRSVQWDEKQNDDLINTTRKPELSKVPNETT